MGKDDHQLLPTRLPSVNKHMFDRQGWHSFAAVNKYNKDLTVWASNTLIKGQHGKKYNLLWLLRRTRDGPGGRGEMNMDELPSSTLSPIANVTRNCTICSTSI